MFPQYLLCHPHGLLRLSHGHFMIFKGSTGILILFLQLMFSIFFYCLILPLLEWVPFVWSPIYNIFFKTFCLVVFFLLINRQVCLNRGYFCIRSSTDVTGFTEFWFIIVLYFTQVTILAFWLSVNNYAHGEFICFSV